MAIKRSREDIELERTIAMANYLILLSRTSGSVGPTNIGPDRVFECKTCNRQFPSFQALGGHRASHKKPRPSMGNDDVDHHTTEDNRTDENTRKSKIHACSICGLKFPIGQALGGHMRRHRPAHTGLSSSLDESSSVIKSTSRSGDDHDHDDHKRVMCLDLNLTPLENGLLEFAGKLAPVVC